MARQQANSTKRQQIATAEQVAAIVPERADENSDTPDLQTDANGANATNSNSKYARRRESNRQSARRIRERRLDERKDLERENDQFRQEIHSLRAYAGALARTNAELMQELALLRGPISTKSPNPYNGVRNGQNSDTNYFTEAMPTPCLSSTLQKGHAGPEINATCVMPAFDSGPSQPNLEPQYDWSMLPPWESEELMKLMDEPILDNSTGLLPDNEKHCRGISLFE